MKIDVYNKRYNNLFKSVRTNNFEKMIANSNNTVRSMWQIVGIESSKIKKSRLDYLDVIKRPDGCDFSSKEELVNSLNSQYVAAAVQCGAP